ncbi:tetratricopeptide repeat protein [Oleiharenicola lentus]|uniref:tetratricopeptide repeat protein n=1 Tax=Oleiharenicola lentus TaxID=2508720 RepID=UPI003F67D5E3
MRLFSCLLLLGCAVSLSYAATDPAAFNAAKELYAQRKPAEAQQAFEKLASADPTNADIQSYLGRLALQRNEPAKAVAHLEKAVALKPEDSRFNQQLGDAYGLSAMKAGLLSKLGFANKCSAAYAKAVSLDPANIGARLSLMEFYRQAPSLAGGGMDKAYAQAAEIKKLDAAQGRAAYAALYASEKKFTEGFTLYEEDLKANPGNYVSLYQVGKLAALSGERVDRGLETLRQCLALTPPEGQPGHAQAHWRIGQILEKKNDRAAARSAYEAALKLEPSFPQAAASLQALQ